eukprot:TRINITY_DN33998_c0_g1_i2.p1 TRINITY_DN33998_c0_g1~~TRINITY_DN33998_c0_g1_i2.p1  ORF type:complete len:183 (+),score=48.04 TRINITY_DN33998_c0_g1_i2:42-590(+)
MRLRAQQARSRRAWHTMEAKAGHWPGCLEWFVWILSSAALLFGVVVKRGDGRATVDAQVEAKGLKRGKCKAKFEAEQNKVKRGGGRSKVEAQQAQEPKRNRKQFEGALREQILRLQLLHQDMEQCAKASEAALDSLAEQLPLWAGGALSLCSSKRESQKLQKARTEKEARLALAAGASVAPG